MIAQISDTSQTFGFSLTPALCVVENYQSCLKCLSLVAQFEDIVEPQSCSQAIQSA